MVARAPFPAIGSVESSIKGEGVCVKWRYMGPLHFEYTHGAARLGRAGSTPAGTLNKSSNDIFFGFPFYVIWVVVSLWVAGPPGVAHTPLLTWFGGYGGRWGHAHWPIFT